MSKRMPVFFFGHGNPMNALEKNEFSTSWIKVVQDVPVPKAILCVSAHWETVGTEVTAMQNPKTIHDFYGFPQELFAVKYPASGSPELAEQICNEIKTIGVKKNHDWGLDHGCWSVLIHLYPEANIPVVQISLDLTQFNQFHFNLGRELTNLRDQGILVIGSGNIVHNLQKMVWEDTAFKWAEEYDEKVKEWILKDDYYSIIHYEEYGMPGFLSVNTGEHYEPLLVILGMKRSGESVQFFAEKIWGGSLSMRCLKIG